MPRPKGWYWLQPPDEVLSVLSNVQRLYYAMLMDAIMHRRICRRAGRCQLCRQDHWWVNSRLTTWPCAFERVCDALYLEPDIIRAGFFSIPQKGGRNEQP